MAGTSLPGWLDDMMSDPKFVDERQLKAEAQAQRDEVLRQKLMTVLRAQQAPPMQAAQDIAPRTAGALPPPLPPPGPPGPPPDAGLPPLDEGPPKIPPIPTAPGAPPPINDYWA